MAGNLGNSGLNMDDQLTEIQHDRNLIASSHTSDVLLNEPCCLGIDEAGRGPVLGAMVYGICYCPISMKDNLAKLGFADSKTLNEAARESLLKTIEDNKDFIGWKVKVLSPNYLSNEMLRRTKNSLNAISHDAAIELTQLALKDGVNVTEMFVDTVGDAAKYQAKLSAIFPGIEVTVTPKADSKFPVVSAASICAKVARDHVLNDWKFAEGEFAPSYGSGYPGDSETKKWLRESIDPVFGFPRLVRFSWSTASVLLDKNAAKVEWEDDEEIDEASKNTMPITSFFKSKQPDDKPKLRHMFFNERSLHPVETLFG